MHVVYGYIEFISNDHKSEIPKITIYYVWYIQQRGRSRE